MKKKIGIIAPFVLLTISFLVSVLFISKNYYVLMNGDTAAEMLYGRLLADESGAMSHNWFYSTELRTLGVQYFYKLGFMLFGNNYYAVRLFADIIMLVVLAASYIFMMSSMGLKKIGIWTAWVIILPFSPVYAYFIIYAEFYSMYSTFCYLLLGNIFLVFRSKDEKIKVALEICLLAVISFVSGLSGVRMAMICLGPALCATLINLYLWFRKNDSFEILEKMKNDLKPEVPSFYTKDYVGTGTSISS